MITLRQPVSIPLSVYAFFLKEQVKRKKMVHEAASDQKFQTPSGNSSILYSKLIHEDKRASFYTVSEELPIRPL